MNEKIINKEFSAFGLALKRDAMICVRDYIKKTNNPEDTLQQILQRIPSISQDSLITKPVIENLISSMRKSSSPEHHIMAFQNAFDMPKFAFDRSERSFISAEKPVSILGNFQDKFSVYKERHQILKTCLVHTREFHASSVQFGLDTSNSYSITDIGSLISKGDETVILLGYLDSDGDRTVTIEDPTGIVPIDTENLGQTMGLFSVGCIVVVQADYKDGVVYGTLIGHPPAQKIEAFYNLFWKVHTDPFGWEMTKEASIELKELLESEHKDSLILFFSDVWIDVPSVVDNFNYALSQYDDSPPNILVISGSFTSRPFSFDQFQSFEKLFSKFCDIIKIHKSICQQSHILIIPSINDLGSAHVYPRPSFPPSLQKIFTDSIPNSHFMTNPCRMKFLNQTITMFRDDLLKRMLNSSVLPVPKTDVNEHLLTTIINQRHLCPVDLEHAPIAWPYDYALRLYPPPDVLVLCDSAPAWEMSMSGVTAFNPGQFGSNKTFIQYFPAESKAEISNIN